MAPTSSSTNNITTAPISWPRVMIGKQSLEIKWSILAEFMLSSWGIDVNELFAQMKPVATFPEQKNESGDIVVPARTQFGPKFTARIFELVAAMAAHNWTSMGHEPAVASWYAEQISDDQYAAVLGAVNVALGKRRAAMQAQAAPSLTQEPTAAQVQ